MDELFARASNILIVWTDQHGLPAFQQTVQLKAKQAFLASESIDQLFQSRRPPSSFDLILYGLVSSRDVRIDIESLSELFRLLRPNGHLITYTQEMKQSQAKDYFKICGFLSSQPLDSNSSFLIEHKDPDVQHAGLLWLCQKPAFKTGYSVPVRRQRVSLVKQVSAAMPGGRGTWTVDHDDLIDTIDGMEEHRKEPVQENGALPRLRPYFRASTLNGSDACWL